MPTGQPRSHNASVTIIENPEALEIIKEEQTSPPASMKLNTSKPRSSILYPEKSCNCITQTRYASNAASTDNLLKEKENELRAEYDKLLEKKITLSRERFNFILENEQLRACYMLREAHRDRQEKIKALESQLECKNLAALMFVMCTERTRSKLEKLKLIEEYTAYINKLQELLNEGQELILNLSRGYKTAARVDHEWREKMNKVVGEFLKFIYHFSDTPEEHNQYFIDLPKLLQTEAPIVDDPEEDPCESYEFEFEEESTVAEEEESPWWNKMDGEKRPFVMFGDMADFKPPQRRRVLNIVKATKTAPKIWKEYVFNEMTLKKSCENVDEIKDAYPHLKRPSLLSDHLQDQESNTEKGFSKISVASRRHTTASLDCRNNDMGSLLKIITSASFNPSKKPSDKSALLGAKDSMEIHSTTKLKHLSEKSESKRDPKAGFTLDINKKCSIGDLRELRQLEEEDAATSKKPPESAQSMVPSVQSGLGSNHHDSLEVITNHKADAVDKINYERYCPVEACRLLQMDSFTRALPPYMRAAHAAPLPAPLLDHYVPCTREQLEILKQRLAAKSGAESEELELSPEPTSEWQAGGGVATQTSLESLLAPCTCACPGARGAPPPAPAPSETGFVFNMCDLIPVKRLIDYIKKECLYDDTIEFVRFKVIGQHSDDSIKPVQRKPGLESNRGGIQAITKILKQHPSLLDIFQANTRC